MECAFPAQKGVNMATTPEMPAAKPDRTNETTRRGGRGAREHVVEGTRYFVAKSPHGSEPPKLDKEVSTEGEALVLAFKSDNRIFVVTEYVVTQQVDGDRVLLVKQPAVSRERVSTINAS
jgi:hypothetical protein